MKSLVGTKIGRRLLGTFILVCLPLVVAGWFGIRHATQALEKQTHKLLRVASDGAEAQVREFLVSLRRTTESEALDDEISLALRSPRGERALDLSDLVKRVQIRVPEVREIYCLNGQGKVVASSVPEMVGKDESASVEFNQGDKGYNPGDIVRQQGTGAIRWRMSAPVKDPATGKAMGVVVVGIDPGSLSALTTGKRVLAEGAATQSFQMGETGETYVVNRNGLLLTESRFATNAILRLKVETEPVRAAVDKGKEIIADYKDYRGVRVAGASAILEKPRWVLVTELNFSQAFAPIRRLRRALLEVSVVMGLFAAFIASHFARRITAPLRLTSQADNALARHHEQAALVPENNLPRDEIGDFIRQRNANVRELFERERELLKEQRCRAEAAAALVKLSYSMVHDMRAPLRAITTFGDLIAEEAGERLTGVHKDYLARMRSACLRMDRLICDMLKYSSLLHAEMALSSVNVSELFQKVVAEHPALRASKEDIEIPDSMPLLLGNSAVLTQCFSALLDNAFKYAKSDVRPKVRVSAETNDGWARIEIEDNGIGMSQQFQRRLFGIFQKAANTSAGTGIGLALVRVAVERMGGQVGVLSEEGKGSRFWIKLRLAAQSRESTPLLTHQRE